MDQGRQGRLVVGFVALHVLCCGLPLLLGAGFLGGAGALLDSPLLLAAAVVLALVVVVVGTRARRRREGCCSPTEVPPSAGATDLAQPRPERFVSAPDTPRG